MKPSLLIPRERHAANCACDFAAACGFAGSEQVRRPFAIPMPLPDIGRHSVSEALDLLDMDAQQIAGLVLNKVSPRWFRLFRRADRDPAQVPGNCGRDGGYRFTSVLSVRVRARRRNVDGAGE